MPLLQSLSLKNFLSFAPDTEQLALHDVNLLIGPNGSGKSNVLDSLALLKATPGDMAAFFREHGGLRDWIWKGAPPSPAPVAELEAVISCDELEHARLPLRYRLSFAETGGRLEIVDERLEYSEPLGNHDRPYLFYGFEQGRPVLNANIPEEGRNRRELRREDINPEKSILAQRYDPDDYPEVSYLGDTLGQLRMYRQWTFGPLSVVRKPQDPSLSDGFLLEDGANLGLILQRIKRSHETRERFKHYVSAVIEGSRDVEIGIEGGFVKIFLEEGGNFIPASRLSDGTLRYLCLLAVLCSPDPGPLVCIDEPELGLHPDLINTVADALRFASQRTQLIVTTHSAELVDAFQDVPEAIVVCEKHEGGTVLSRLEPERLRPWLEKYRLGELWSSGEIGGNRW